LCDASLKKTPAAAENIKGSTNLLIPFGSPPMKVI